MGRVFLAVAIATLTVPAAPPMKVLFIGNSLTTVNDVPGIVEALSAGQVKTRTVAFNDHSLEDHWNRQEARKAIAEGGPSTALGTGWSYVVLQQGPSALPESRALLIEYVKRFDAQIRKVGARTAIYSVWPSWQRRDDFKAVSASHAAAAKAVSAVLLPVGDAWQEAWKRDANIALYGIDGFHPTLAASYLAATVIYASLSGRPMSELPTTANMLPRPLVIAPSQAYLLQSAAEAALSPLAEVFPTPRLAALNFAIAHGFDLQRSDLVVANDVRFGGINDVRAVPNDRSTTLSQSETVADTQKLAAMLGPAVKNVWGSTVLACGRTAGLSVGECKTTANVWALVVEELKNNGNAVHIKLHPPGGKGKVGHAFVTVERRGAGWVAIEYMVAPMQAGGR